MCKKQPRKKCHLFFILASKFAQQSYWWYRNSSYRSKHFSQPTNAHPEADKQNPDDLLRYRCYWVELGQPRVLARLGLSNQQGFIFLFIFFFLLGQENYSEEASNL